VLPRGHTENQAWRLAQRVCEQVALINQEQADRNRESKEADAGARPVILVDAAFSINPNRRVADQADPDPGLNRQQRTGLRRAACN
jgi:hypothetical protein